MELPVAEKPDPGSARWEFLNVAYAHHRHLGSELE